MEHEYLQWQEHEVHTRPDNSYIIMVNGQPYHVPSPSDPEGKEFAELWAEVDAFTHAYPERVMPEPGPAEPSLDEIKARKRVEIKSGYDAALIATLTMPESEPSPSETAVQAALFATEDGAGLADVLAILNTRRQELELAVNAAQSVADVQAVAVGYPV